MRRRRKNWNNGPDTAPWLWNPNLLQPALAPLAASRQTPPLSLLIKKTSNKYQHFGKAEAQRRQNIERDTNPKVPLAVL